jgi:hypothetical protein
MSRASFRSSRTHTLDNQRRIHANDRQFNSQFRYASNYIKTSKYSILTFLPLNLFEQFQRLANFYFLCLLVLQLIPAISSLTPVTTALPLIGVLGLTAIKDAYDDIVSVRGGGAFREFSGVFFFTATSHFRLPSQQQEVASGAQGQTCPGKVVGGAGRRCHTHGQ